MPRITRVYTRTGDDGTTGLSNGQRVDKESPRVAAYGEVDELNSQIGLVQAEEVTERLRPELARIQNELFHLGADLSMPEETETFPVPRIGAAHVDALEKLMDELATEIPPLENFVLPGGAVGAARLHVARAVCRRAERAVSALGRLEAMGPWPLKYLNRLSDALFVMARFENVANEVEEPLWDSRR